jgi:4-hydroxy-3-methylbut-2-enyl diphosphate reductase
MKVKIARKVGFCFGVKRAVAMAQRAIEDNKKIYSLGSIIHNPQVVKRLSEKGLKEARNIRAISGAAVVISSHGISPDERSAIASKAAKVIDTTCPFVLKAQRIAGKLSRDGYLVVIVGDAAHPEVRALVGFAGDKALVIKDPGAAGRSKRLKNARVAVISQTTQSPGKFSEVVRAISERSPKEIKVFNTICRDAEERQEAARRLAGSVDTMLVIGGRNSANTRRLYEVCKAALGNSHLVESQADIRASWFGRSRAVGITSGASTPDWIVRKVVQNIRLRRYLSA